MRSTTAIGSALLLGWAARAEAADLFVDASAAAGGDGSQSTPFQQIQAGLDAAEPGDVVHVAPGSYDALQTVRAGSADARITVRATAARQAIVQASGTALEATHPNHTFEGLVLDAGYGAGDAVTADGADGLELLDVEVRHAAADCIDLRTVSGVLVDRSTIHHCVRFADGAVADAHGITGDSVFDLTVRDSEIYLFSGDAFQLSPPREPWGNVLITGCRLWTGPLDVDSNGVSAGTVVGENAVDTKVATGESPTLGILDVVAYGFRGFISNGAAFNIKEEVDATIDRVTVHGSEIAFRLRFPATVRVQNAVVYESDKAFRLEDGLLDAQILASTIAASVAEPFETAGDEPQAAVLRNLLFGAAEVPSFAAADASNMAFGAAAFVDAAANELHLATGGPAVDVGVSLDGVTTDRDGAPRPFGPAFDVGAYEWTDQPIPEGGAGGGGSTGTGGLSAGGSSASGGHGGEVGSPAGDVDEEGGCGCRASPRAGSGGLGCALLVAAALRARRRRARSETGRA